jgi:hypothetical protein
VTPFGDEPGRLLYTDERQLSREGRFVRQPPPDLLRRLEEESNEFSKRR